MPQALQQNDEIFTLPTMKKKPILQWAFFLLQPNYWMISDVQVERSYC